MAITPISGGPGIAPLGPIPIEPTRTGGKGGADAASSGAERVAAPAPARSAQDLQELKQLSAHSGLEVKYVTLPDSNATLLRLVDPATGRVMREFRPEGVAIALAELKAKAISRPKRSILDHQA